MEKTTIGRWTLNFDGKQIPAQVPGDITVDLFNAGLIKDPYYGLNYRENEWIARKDFTYEAEIEATDDMLAEESIRIIFDGIDVYSDVYLNGILLGNTDNMFLSYSFEIRDHLKKGINKLAVCMKSTLNKMDTFDVDGYEAIFNKKRIFVRKAQCHFGWDWAPKICAYGIWESVYLEYGSKKRIDNVYVVASDEGDATLFVELNYDVHERFDDNGLLYFDVDISKENDVIHYYLSKKPFGNEYIKKTFKVTGKKNFACFILDDAELWWPAGYGKQPLYNYRVELERDGKIVSEKSGRIGFRSVKLIEKPQGDSFIGYQLEINGKRIFARGANWIPIECFTGVVKDEKYDRLTDLALNANYNMLRVWGGGIYEKDIFFDLCDEKGILTWQDVMLACADIPEDNSEFVQNTLKEVEYQVKRLRNHPSLVYWCGGNEKTGSYGRCITRGDFFVNVLIQGTILNLDRTRPFARQSPVSHTDVGQDGNSGESHHNSFERSLVDGVRNYRSLVSERRVPFVSEAALMGPNTVEANKRMYPEDKLWPMNELWDDRLMENPYGSVPLTFAKRQVKYATDMYGELKGLEDFTAKAMLIHAEAMRAEAEFARAGEGITSGFMCWMFSDIWPSGSWSVVDYWCEPKQVLYQMQRSFEPRLVTFVENHDGETELTVINDTLNPFTTTVRYGVKAYDGRVLFEDKAQINGLIDRVFVKKVEFNCDRSDIYLFAEYSDDGKARKNIYSPKMWVDTKFESDYTVSTERVSDREIKVKIKANAFAKSVFISFKDNYKYTYSDNYLDIEAGEEITVTVTSPDYIDEKQMTVTDFARMTV